MNPRDTIAIFDGCNTQPVVNELVCGTIVSYTTRCPDKSGANEDAIGIVGYEDGRTVIIIADGFGGQPAGDQASQLAVESIIASISQNVESIVELREGILNGFEEANRAVIGLGVGAATTLAVVEIDSGTVRPYHVGDSEIIIVGQRGKLKLQTVSHSPVGYGVEAGLIDRDDAMHHEERNIVSNMVGSPDMHIDIGPRISLRPLDTLLMATDGIFDNLAIEEVVELIRKGNPVVACGRLVDACAARMASPQPHSPHKPDDIAAIMFRLA